MTLELVQSTYEHSDEIARVFYEAYKDLTDRHNFPLVFPSTDVARQAISKVWDCKHMYAVTAILDGQIAGSAFVWLMDGVAGIGPVSVDPRFQGQNVAKPMMEHLLKHTNSQGYSKVRLSQRAYNPLSLSLYAKVGFNTVGSFMEMTAAPTSDPDGAVRLWTESDLGEIQRLSERFYGINRTKDFEVMGFTGNPATLVRENGKGLSGYLSVGTMFGHGIAETDEDILALVGEATIRFPDRATFNCSLSNGELYRKLLNQGCRAVEIHTQMAYGPYEPPKGVCLPSAQY